jgi:hypothetical protein
MGAGEALGEKFLMGEEVIDHAEIYVFTLFYAGLYFFDVLRIQIQVHLKLA